VESGLFVTSARKIIRGTGVAALATLEPGTGSPYASMLTVATETDGTPVFLISRLAWHTRNLEADSRASILFCAGGESSDPLALGRVSVMGRAERTGNELARERFLARHPEAAGYAGFADFSLWRLLPEKAHHVGGFGQIGTVPGDALIRPAQTARAWDAEIGVTLADLNAHHGALIARLAVQHGGGAADGASTLAACDPDGAELIADGRTLRLAFSEPVQNVYQILQELQRLEANKVRSG
jgi:heme oxygenase (biliverdin-IX-beta and delta-forming)